MRLLKLLLKKEMSLGMWTLKRPQPPERLRVPVFNHAPFYQMPCVRPGEIVSCGAKIAEPRSSFGISAFSPVNGVIQEITSCITAAGESVLTVEIQVDRKNAYSFLSSGESAAWQDATAERLKTQIREAGVMLCAKKAQPLHLVLDAAHFYHKTLVVNACESEPYVTSAQALLLARPLEVLKGAEILRRAAGLEKIIFAISEHVEQAAEILKSKIYFSKWNHLRIEVLPARYPQDEPAVLLPRLDSTLKNTDPHKFKNLTLPDIATVFAVYEAVVLNKPFFERVVTISGECVVQPQNLIIPFGTTAADAVKACKGFLREPGRVIAGGPMRGRALADMNAPLSAATDAVIGLPKELTVSAPEVDCIRCRECVDVCPVHLSPALIAMAAKNLDFDRACELDAVQCIACGNCAYVCPSHLPLVDIVQGCF